MSFFVQLLEAIAIVVPDVLTLGLLAPAFFSLYCIAKALGLAGTADMDSALGISLIARVFGHRRCQHHESCTNSSAIEIDDHVPLEVKNRPVWA